LTDTLIMNKTQNYNKRNLLDCPESRAASFQKRYIPVQPQEMLILKSGFVRQGRVFKGAILFNDLFLNKSLSIYNIKIITQGGCEL